MWRALAGLCLIGLAGCASGGGSVPVYAPPQGINQVLEGPIASAPGHSLILGDLNMPAEAEIPRHYHHGEEYIYVLGGSATVSREGMPDVTLRPGQSIVIPTGVVHWGVVGPKGLRSISAWVKDESKPLRETIAP